MGPLHRLSPLCADCSVASKSLQIVKAGLSNGILTTVRTDVSRHSGWVSSCRSPPIHSSWALSWTLPAEQQARLKFTVVDESQSHQEGTVCLLLYFIQAWPFYWVRTINILSRQTQYYYQCPAEIFSNPIITDFKGLRFSLNLAWLLNSLGRRSQFSMSWSTMTDNDYSLPLEMKS